MKRKFSILLILFLISVSGFARAEENESALDSLVKSELEFAKWASEKGIRDAFLNFLSDNSILFRPGPVPGKKWLQDRPAAPGLLTWYPIFADVSSSGDMGYTTGPWEFRKNGPDDKEVGHGQFNSVWIKQADGSWKVEMDIGISNPAPASKEKVFVSTSTLKSNSIKDNKKVDREAEIAAIIKEDRDFSKASQEKGTATAFLSYVSDDVRIFRPNNFPVVGKQAMQAFFVEKAEQMKWQPISGNVAHSGDLGYTYGSYESKKADQVLQGHYMRVWKKQSNGDWKIVLDVVNPLPPQQKAAN
jgi:ketosteroid isomerase-like protein